MTRDTEVERGSVDRLEKLDRQLEFQVVAAGGPVARSPGAEAEHPSEKVRQITEPGRADVEAGEGIEARAECFVTAAIVLGALGGIRKHRERLGDFLELLLGLRVALVDVGVVLAGEPPVGRLDLLLAGVA